MIFSEHLSISCDKWFGDSAHFGTMRYMFSRCDVGTDVATNLESFSTEHCTIGIDMVFFGLHFTDVHEFHRKQ